jgi:hypothetical protein
MTDIEFSTPSGGGNFIDAKNHVGHLILIPLVMSKSSRPDKFNGGEQDVVEIVFVDLNDGKGGEARTGVKLSARWLVADLAPGQTNFLGRIVEKDTGRQNPAIVWESPTDPDFEVAKQWILANPDAGKPQQMFSGAPAAAPAAPAADDRHAAMLAQLQ